LIVLDANILIRAVLGRRVAELIEKYASSVRLHAPELAFREAEKHIPRIVERRSAAGTWTHGRTGTGPLTMSKLRELIEIVPEAILQTSEDEARKRMKRRDPNDTPILAAALALDCPIWTEDMDFFGVGVATWTTDNVEIYFESQVGAE
jgi:predicted nucleic acid-binding protein